MEPDIRDGRCDDAPARGIGSNRAVQTVDIRRDGNHDAFLGRRSCLCEESARLEHRSSSLTTSSSKQVEECYPRPRYLAVIVMAMLFILLTHFAGNTLAFAKLVLQAFEPDQPNPDFRLQKFIALCLLSCVCLLHIFSRKMGIAVNNMLAIYKVTLVTFIIIIGFAAMGGARGKGRHSKGLTGPYGMENWKHAMDTTPKSMSDYSMAILGVLWAYTGWENANYVLSEVRRPPGNESRVFKVAAFSAMGVTTVLYVLANVAYFTVLSDMELATDGDMVAAKFFIKVFGEGWFIERGFKVMVALSIMGNFVSSTYGLARVKQEIAKLRILPFSKFFAHQSHYDTPVGALILHWFVAASFIVSYILDAGMAYNID